MNKTSLSISLRIISLVLGVIGILLVLHSTELGMAQADSLGDKRAEVGSGTRFWLMQQSGITAYRTLGTLLTVVGLFHALRPLSQLEMERLERLDVSSKEPTQKHDVNENNSDGLYEMKEGFNPQMRTSGGNRIDTASRFMNVSPQTIYWAFVDPDVLVRWLPPKGMRGQIDLFEPHTGGAYRIVLTHTGASGSFEGKSSPNTDIIEGCFVELVPGEKIVQTAVFDSSDPSFAGEMILTWNLELVGERTKVTVLCEGVPVGIKRDEHKRALESTLANLEQVVG